MIKKFKQILYFQIAYYFRFFAAIHLLFWKPRIFVITGSTSKTTLLHLIQAQLTTKARYSLHANSSFGIPFDILGLKRKTFHLWEWPFLFILAPLKVFRAPFKERIYFVEADCDRVGEGKFLATLLKPEVTIWLNSSNSHAQNFPAPTEENIAYEFGFFIENTQKLCIVNGDSNLINSQLKRTKALIKKIIKKGHLQDYKLQTNGTTYKIDDILYSFRFLLPEDSFYSVSMCLAVLDYLGIEIDGDFSNFILPPGRSSLFKGIKNTTLVDSTYNATPASMKVILEMFTAFPAKNKWLILGDMIELGIEEQSEHQKLAEEISKVGAEKIILVGPRLLKYTYRKLNPLHVEAFDGPRQALDYIEANIQGGEVLLFKGARFLEGIIEQILKNKNDVSKLCRRELVWQKRRKKWGL